MQASDPHVSPSTRHAPPGNRGGQKQTRRAGGGAQTGAQPRAAPGGGTGRSPSPARGPGGGSPAAAAAACSACPRPGNPSSNQLRPPPAGSRFRPGQSVRPRRLVQPARGAAGRGSGGEGSEVGQRPGGERAAGPSLPGAETVVDFLRRLPGRDIGLPEPSCGSLVPRLSAPRRSLPLLPSPSHLTAP